MRQRPRFRLPATPRPRHPLPNRDRPVGGKPAVAPGCGNTPGSATKAAAAAGGRTKQDKKKAFCKHGSPVLRPPTTVVQPGPGRHKTRIGQSQHRPFSGAATRDDCKQSTDGAEGKLKRRPPHATRNKRPLADAAGSSRPDRTRPSRFPQVRHTVSQRAPPTWKTRETR